MITTLNILAIITYLMTWVLIVVRVRGQLNQYRDKCRVYLKITWSLALLLQGCSLYIPLLQSGSLSLDLISALSQVLWLLSLLIFYTTFRYKIETLALFVIPMVILGIVLRFFSVDWNMTPLSGGMSIHIFTSLFAYSVLFFASIQAALLTYQHHQLHRHQTLGLMRTLPPLQEMEALLFQLINIGVVLLSMALLSGFFYLDDLFEQDVAHKTILSVIAWLLFASLLFKRYRYGCRSKLATRWTLFASVFLFLAYFGSKFVFEYILH
jgi:ABC-type uncharacterized transport system permease subunit